MAFQAPEPAAVAHHGRQRAAAAGDRGALPQRASSSKRKRVRRQGRASCWQERGPGRLRGQVSVAALGGHAAAGQHLPRAGARAQDAAARRALRRARRFHARRTLVHRCATCTRRRNSTSSSSPTTCARASSWPTPCTCMSKQPGPLRRAAATSILPRPRDLEVTYTAEVHRHRPRVARPHRRHAQDRRGGLPAMKSAHEEQVPTRARLAADRCWSAIAAAVGDSSCSAVLGAATSSSPAPSADRAAVRSEFTAGPLLEAMPGSTFWVTMIGFAISHRGGCDARLSHRQFARWPTTRCIR